MVQGTVDAIFTAGYFYIDVWYEHVGYNLILHTPSASRHTACTPFPLRLSSCTPLFLKLQFKRSGVQEVGFVGGCYVWLDEDI